MVHELDAVVDNRGKRMYFHRTANVAMGDPDGTPIRVSVVSRKRSSLCAIEPKANKAYLADTKSSAVDVNSSASEEIWR